MAQPRTHAVQVPPAQYAPQLVSLLTGHRRALGYRLEQGIDRSAIRFAALIGLVGQGVEPIRQLLLNLLPIVSAVDCRWLR
jgi:hypothetical protein